MPKKPRPIAQRLGQSAGDEAGKKATETSLLSVDDQIAALEQQLEDDSSSSSSDSDSDDTDEQLEEEEEEEEEDAASAAKPSKKRKGVFCVRVRRRSKQACAAASASDGVLRLSSLKNDRIEPLPEHMLPKAHSSTKASAGSGEAGKQRAKERGTGAGDAEDKRQARFKRRQKTVLDSRELMQKYETSSHRPLYCRVCCFQAKSEEEFYAHRESPEHQVAFQEEKKLTACQLCRKQFTSAAQLKEHLIGKAHKERLEKFKQGAAKGAGGKGKGKGKGNSKGKGNGKGVGNSGGGKGKGKGKGKGRGQFSGICHAFQRGECKRGRFCIFSHDEAAAAWTNDTSSW